MNYCKYCKGKFDYISFVISNGTSPVLCFFSLKYFWDSKLVLMCSQGRLSGVSEGTISLKHRTLVCVCVCNGACLSCMLVQPIEFLSIITSGIMEVRLAVCLLLLFRASPLGSVVSIFSLFVLGVGCHTNSST